MLVQTDKFGTSVAQSLRVHSDTVRTKRRQRAEEAAAKTGVKMVFPLVFCIFPAIWVVTIGPAAIKFVQVLVPMAQQMSVAATATRRRRPTLAPAPPVPRTLEDTGLAADQVEQLLIKTLYGGELTGLVHRRADAAAVLRSSSRSSSALRAERLIEVRGATGIGTAGYRYALTDLGRDRARQYLDDQPVRRRRRRCRSPAYVAQMQALPAARGYIDRERLRKGFSHLIISDDVLEQLGPGGQRGQGGVPLRPARQRQDRDRRRHGPHARRRHVHAARDRRRRPHHHDVRPDQPRVARGGRRAVEHHRARRRAIAAGCASAVRSSWSAAS